MRKSKQKSKPVKQHTPAERLALRHKKRKEGPSAKRRQEARTEFRSKRIHDELITEKTNQIINAAIEQGISIKEIFANGEKTREV